MLTSTFVAMIFVAVERVGETSCEQRAASSASSGSVLKESAKYQASATKAAARESPSTRTVATEVARRRARAARVRAKVCGLWTRGGG